MRLDLRPERPDLRPEGSDEGGGTNERTDERTNESPPVFYRTSSPSGPLPCSLPTFITSYSSRARVPLTTYRLWAAIRTRIWPLRPQSWPLRPQIWPLRSQIQPLRPHIRPLRPQIRPLRPQIWFFFVILFQL